MKNTPIKLLDNLEIKVTNEELNAYIKTQDNYIPTGVNMINAPLMWNKGYTGEGVKIAILDSGYTPHPDLDKNIIGGKNFTSEDGGNPNIFNDYNGHGTHVAGIIASDNKIMGVAPNAKLLILKVLDKTGNGNCQGMYDAINYAIEQKVDIINMSLGISINVNEIHTMLKKAVDNNICVVCACGNEGDGKAFTDEYSYPAGYNEAISVGAIDNARVNAVFTNSNKEVDLVAHGVNVVSTHLNYGYCSMSGTSQATPHVTGALALLKEYYRKTFEKEPTEVELYAQLIKRTVELNLDRKLQGQGMLFL